MFADKLPRHADEENSNNELRWRVHGIMASNSERHVGTASSNGEPDPLLW